MNHKKPYDLWIQWVITNECNQNCHYCINKLEYHKKGPPLSDVDIASLLRTLNHTGKTCLVAMTGGEPFLVPNIIEVCRELTKDHYIALITNLTLFEAVEAFSERIDPRKVDYMIATAHVEPLEKLKRVSRFVEAFSLLKERGFPVQAHRLAYPGFCEGGEMVFEQLEAKGFDAAFVPYIGTYDGKKYPEAYTKDEVGLFGLDEDRIDHFSSKGSPCNAGYNTTVVYATGDAHPCFHVEHKLGNIYTGIRFLEKVMTCPSERCTCPLFYYEPHLYGRALRETESVKARLGRLLGVHSMPKKGLQKTVPS